MVLIVALEERANHQEIEFQATQPNEAQRGGVAGWRALAHEQWRTGDARAAQPSCHLWAARGGEALAGDLPPSCRCSQPWQSEREWIEGCAWVCVREGNEQTTERHHVVLVRVCVRLCVLDNERARIVLYPAAAPAAD